MTIGVIVHSDSYAPGHGPGVTTLLTSSTGNIKPLLDETANISIDLGIKTIQHRQTLGYGANQKTCYRSALSRNADVFVAMDPSDTRNAMAAQKARHLFNIPKVVCYIDDPLRQEMYKTLGLMAISPVQVISDMVMEAIHR